MDPLDVVSVPLAVDDDSDSDCIVIDVAASSSDPLQVIDVAASSSDPLLSVPLIQPPPKPSKPKRMRRPKGCAAPKRERKKSTTRSHCQRAPRLPVKRKVP